MQGHQINIWSNNAWSPECLCTTLDVFSKSTSGSMCPLLAASWQLSLSTDETFLRWELSHYCEVIKDCSICSLVPLLSFLIDLSQALREREQHSASLSHQNVPLFMCLSSSVRKYLIGRHQVRLQLKLAAMYTSDVLSSWLTLLYFIWQRCINLCETM